MVQLQCFSLKDLPNAVKPFKLFFYDLVDIVVAMATNFEKPFYS